ncbi:MAG: glutamate-1-semialdehyde 2,1-aminomutase [Candidatus Dormibacteria bacterium]
MTAPAGHVRGGRERSDALMGRAQRVIPGGVSSPVRAFGPVGGTPLFMDSGEGSIVVDADGNRRVDFVMGYGPHILGHAAPAVLEAVRAQTLRGTSFGAPHELEVELAERIVSAMDSVELVRFVNSGTEATMSAIRLARAATGRDRIVKCAGGYHGHADPLLVQGGSGIATLGIPGSPGVPAAAVADTMVVPFNDTSAAAEVFASDGATIAALIVEPVAGNMGCVPPLPGYLEALREITSAAGSLLILDEVMTGFRVAYGGAQELYGIAADLTCLGKVIGAGLPVGAYGGRGELMSLVAPAGPVYQAGTLSGNPLAMAAGCAVLDELSSGLPYGQLDELGRRFAEGIAGAARKAGVPCAVNRVGSMLTPFLGVEEVVDLRSARMASTTLFSDLHGAWLDAGISWPPSQFEAGFISTAHSEGDIDAAVAAFAGSPAMSGRTDPFGAPRRSKG